MKRFQLVEANEPYDKVLFESENYAELIEEAKKQQVPLVVLRYRLDMYLAVLTRPEDLHFDEPLKIGLNSVSAYLKQELSLVENIIK